MVLLVRAAERCGRTMKENFKYEVNALVARQRQLTEQLRNLSTPFEIEEQAHRELLGILSQLEQVPAAEKKRLPHYIR